MMDLLVPAFNGPDLMVPAFPASLLMMEFLPFTYIWLWQHLLLMTSLLQLCEQNYLILQQYCLLFNKFSANASLYALTLRARHFLTSNKKISSLEVEISMKACCIHLHNYSNKY